jgi:SnoaL-like domain
VSKQVTPVSEPVTGREPWSDLTQPLAALAQFYRALNTRDLALLQENWEESPEAAMDNPLGGTRRGWAEIRTVYERLFRSAATFRFEFWDYTLYETAEVCRLSACSAGQG